MNARTTPTPLLTATDRHTIAYARVLTGLSGPDAVRAHTGDTLTGGEDEAMALATTVMAYAVAFGRAQHHIRDLVAIIERLGGGNG